MKKVKIIISALILSCLMLNMPAFAEAEQSSERLYPEIQTSMKLSDEKIELLKQIWAGEKENQETRGNLLCSLFGHTIEEGSMIVVDHLVRDEAPRCKKSYCTTEVCTRSGCDYANVTVDGEVYFFCGEH